MGVRVTTDFETRFAAYLGRVERSIYDELASAVAAVVENAVQNAREFTAERGRPSSRFGGRIETSAMISALKGKVEEEAKRITGEFGFIGEIQDYYIYQTVTGFTHYLSSAYIEPTFAIRDAGLIATDDMLAAIRSAISKVK